MYAYSLVVFTLLFLAQLWTPAKAFDYGELLWSEEFKSSDVLDPNVWSYMIGPGFISLNYNTNSSNNTFIYKGYLWLVSRSEQMQGYFFTSANLFTQRTFKYGIIEIRAVMPQGKGIMSVIGLRLLNETKNDTYGTFQTFNLGSQPNRTCTVVTSSYANDSQQYSQSANGFFNNDGRFHLYRIDWSDTRLKFYVDDTLYMIHEKSKLSAAYKWSFDTSLRLSLSGVVGGEWAGGYGLDNRIFPTYFVIDYVRHYAPAILATSETTTQGASMTRYLNTQLIFWLLSISFYINFFF